MEQDTPKRPDYERVIASTMGNDVRVTITQGYDGKPVVFIDTGVDLETDQGPHIRIRLNDELVYGGGQLYGEPAP